MPAEINTTLKLYDIAGLLPPLLADHGEAFGEGRRTALMAALAPPSPVDRIEQSMEAIYGALKDGDDLPDQALVVCAQAAFHIVQFGFHFPARAAQIYQVCRRQLGLTATADTPDPADDPDARPLPAPEAPPA